jgi:hypothetical protein
MSNIIKKITWNDVNWTKTRNYVRKLQHRIYKAKKEGNQKKGLVVTKVSHKQYGS